MDVDFGTLLMCCKHRQAWTDLILQPFHEKTVQDLLKTAWVPKLAPILKPFWTHFRTRGALVASSICSQIRDPEKTAGAAIEITRGTSAQAPRDSGYIEMVHGPWSMVHGSWSMLHGP